MSADSTSAGNGEAAGSLQLPHDTLIDEQIKVAQLDKLRAEVRNLQSWNYEIVSKLLPAIIALALAIWAFYIGLPQARYDLIRAMEERSSTRSTAESLKEEAQKTAQELAAYGYKLDAAKEQLAETKSELDAAQRQRNEAANALVQTQRALQMVRAAAKGSEREVVNAAVKRVIFVQFAGGLERSTIDDYRKLLSNSGFNTPRAERINRDQKNQIKYFSGTQQEKATATAVAKFTNEFFEARGCPLQPPATPQYVQLPNNKQAPIEVWLIGNCK